MVVKKVIVLFVATCLLCVECLATRYSPMCSRIPFVFKHQLENGIEQWLLLESKYNNNKGWESMMLNAWQSRGLDTVLFVDELKKTKKDNHYNDKWGRIYVAYDSLPSIFYAIRVLNYYNTLMGGCVCVQNICFYDGRCTHLNELSEVEINEALKNFKKNILPRIKKYVRSE